MYKKIAFITTFSIAIGLNAFAQNTNGPAVQLAQKIAQKMKDSLDLTGDQKNSIYDVNMNLHNQKQTARTANAGNPQLMTTAIQNIEKTRDSLYQPILTVPQYDLYKQKKRNLVSSN
jgi:hypothetical protein